MTNLFNLSCHYSTYWLTGNMFFLHSSLKDCNRFHAGEVLPALWSKGKTSFLMRKEYSAESADDFSKSLLSIKHRERLEWEVAFVVNYNILIVYFVIKMTALITLKAALFSFNLFWLYNYCLISYDFILGLWTQETNRTNNIQVSKSCANVWHCMLTVKPLEGQCKFFHYHAF